jgi:hypothetical protein
MNLVELMQSKSDNELIKLWGLFDYYNEMPHDEWTKEEWGLVLLSELKKRNIKS